MPKRVDGIGDDVGAFAGVLVLGAGGKRCYGILYEGLNVVATCGQPTLLSMHTQKHKTMRIPLHSAVVDCMYSDTFDLTLSLILFTVTVWFGAIISL